MAAQPDIQYNRSSGDEVRKTTCYMCACRCGINVHLRRGKVSYIEGNRDSPVNRGVLCAKGSAGIMQHYSPARLKKPLLRTGARGKNAFREITWEEALDIAVSWLKPIRQTDPKKLAFFTGRDQSQSLTAWWAQQFGTCNYAAHGGFCSVNMAAAGIYTIGGSFWEFGQPDWEHTRLLLLFGVAEDHDSNPIKTGLAKIRQNGGRIVSINPIRTGYSAIADDWIAIRPGTDGLLILSLIHELLRTRRVDMDYLLRYSNAPWLVIDNPGQDDDGLFVRNEDGVAQVADRHTGRPVSFDTPVAAPQLHGTVTTADGKQAKPVFEKMAQAYLDARYAPDNVARITGVEAQTIRNLADELAGIAFEEAIRIPQTWRDTRGRTHDEFIGRPVSMHAMRGIAAHSNGFQTCRALHILQLLLGSIDCPGGFRFKPPYPKPCTLQNRPGRSGAIGGNGEEAGQPLDNPPLGFVQGPEDLLIDEQGAPMRIDKAFSWEAPLSVHGMMHTVIANAHAGDPYPIDTLFMYMSNMAWNSSMNTRAVQTMLTDRDEESGDYVIPHIIYSDAYASEMVAYADLVLPDTTYLERFDCISLLDRPVGEPELVADAIRWPVVEPDRDVRGFQSVLLELGARLQLPGFVDDRGEARFSDYADYMVHHERRPGVGPLAGWRGAGGELAGRGAPNPAQIDAYIKNGGFWSQPIPDDARYYKHANQGYQDFATGIGLVDAPAPVTFQLYAEVLQRFRLAALGHGKVQPPDNLRDQIARCFSPLAHWYESFEGCRVDDNAYPLHALTQRPMAMYHSWGSQNAWLRQIHPKNVLYVPHTLCAEMDLQAGDWVWMISHNGRMKVPVQPMHALNAQTVWTWNAIGKMPGAWQLSPRASEARQGFIINHLISELLPQKKEETRARALNVDPVTGQAAWFDLRVRLEKAEPDEGTTQPVFDALAPLDGLQAPPKELRFDGNAPGEDA